MGKETKEMLKTINSNLEAIMKHLKIEKSEPKHIQPVKTKARKQTVQVVKTKLKRK